MRHLACILAQPHIYHDAIQCWNTNHPNQPFSTITRPNVDIDHLPLSMMDINATMVMYHAICNGIPPWVDHTYLFGLHCLNHYSLTSPGIALGTLHNANSNWLAQLGTYGTLPSLPEWSGWWAPHKNDLIHVCVLMQKDKQDHN